MLWLPRYTFIWDVFWVLYKQNFYWEGIVGYANVSLLLKKTHFTSTYQLCDILAFPWKRAISISASPIIANVLHSGQLKDILEACQVELDTFHQ